MKLAVVLPGELPEEAKSALQAEYKRIVAPGTDTARFTVKGKDLEPARWMRLLYKMAVIS